MKIFIRGTHSRPKTLHLLSELKFFISSFHEMILNENDIGVLKVCLIFTHSVDYPFLTYYQFPNY